MTAAIRQKEIVHVFDFDGTLTRKDSFIALIRCKAGWAGLGLGLLLYSPLLVLMKLRLYPNGKAKQRVFAHFFKGMAMQAFGQICWQTALQQHDILRPEAVAKLNEVIQSSHHAVIVSASAPEWVRCFFPSDAMPVIVGTELEVANDHLTGRFKTPNCYGAEKVRRLEVLLRKPRNEYHIVAYGDSRGDKQLLAYADEAYYKPFRSKKSR